MKEHRQSPLQTLPSKSVDTHCFFSKEVVEKKNAFKTLSELR